MRFVLITGTSTGIGLATAMRLAAAGFHVFAGVRTGADGERVRAAGGRNLTPLILDVTDPEAIAAAAERVAAEVGDAGLAGLVNNAGIAVSGPLAHLPLDDFRRQLEVNLTGVLAVTQAFLPLLGARADHGAPPGRIVNISSVSGRIAAPFVGAYAASKHGVEALSDSLRRELSVYGIKVVVIQPGRIRTPIWEKVGETARYEGTVYGPVLERLARRNRERLTRGLPPEVVARAVHRALVAKKPKIRQALPDERWLGWVLPRLLPDSWLDRAIERMVFRNGDRRG